MPEGMIDRPAAIVGSTKRRRALTVVLAAVGAVSAWAIVELGFGYDLHGPAMGGSPAIDIGFGAVLATSLGVGLVGWAVLMALERWTSRPRLIWTVAGVVALLFSLAGPLGGDGAEAATRALLVVLHVVVAATLIPGLASTLPRAGQ